MPARQRLSAEERRSHLLDVGVELFTREHFEELSMADVAAAAGVSRRLLYHYFPTKAEFFGAIWHRAHESLRTAVSEIRADTVREAVDAALAAYVDFYQANLPLVVIANRSSVAHDPAVRAPVERDLAALCTTFLDRVDVSGRSRQIAESAFAGWIAFVRVCTLAALVDGRISRAENQALCMDALDATVGAYVDLHVTARA